MVAERTRQRQFDLAPGELVQFHGLPGIRPATFAEARSGAGDLFWSASGSAARPFVSEMLSTDEVLAALAPPAPRPDYLELRPGLHHGGVAVTVPGAVGRPERTFEIEATEWGLRQLAGLVAAQARGRAVPAPAPYGPDRRWVPSEWAKVGVGAGKVRQFDQQGRATERVGSFEELGL